MNRLLLRLTLFMLLAAGLFAGGSWIAAQRLTRPRPVVIGAPPADFPYRIQSVTFFSSDGETLAGWFVPTEKPAEINSDSDKLTDWFMPAAKPTEKAIVLLHGFTGNRIQMLARARFFRQLGYAVLLYDARACGESTGQCITFGYRERHDLLAAVAFLKTRGYGRIACLGVSQGGATILFAAEELQVQCVICESVYDEMTHAVDRRMRRYTGVPGWLGASLLVPFAEQRLDLPIDDVRPVDHIGKLSCPVFLISGEKDDRTWPEDTQRLFDAAREPKELWMLPNAGHEDLFRYDGYERTVKAFLDRHFN